MPYAAVEDDGSYDEDQSFSSDEGASDTPPASDDEGGGRSDSPPPPAAATPAVELKLPENIMKRWEKILVKTKTVNASDIVYDSDAAPLGAGAFGQVRAARFKGKNNRVAVKTMLQAADEKALDDFTYELRIMASLAKKNPKGRHTTRLVGAFALNGVLHAVLEFALVGSLDTIVIDSKRSAGAAELSAAEKANYAFQIACGLKEIHDARIVHRDLASRNVLAFFTPDTMETQLKICDFGLALKLNKVTKNMSAVLNDFVKLDANAPRPVCWTAPEAFAGWHGRCSDIWSFGCVLFELFSGKFPFNGDHAALDVKALVAGKLNPITAAGMPAQAKEVGLDGLITRCFQFGGVAPPPGKTDLRQITRRPTVDDIIQELAKFK
jgi:serine/threonine protein kinase